MLKTGEVSVFSKLAWNETILSVTIICVCSFTRLIPSIRRDTFFPNAQIRKWMQAVWNATQGNMQGTKEQEQSYVTHNLMINSNESHAVIGDLHS